jgi:hypothetical protein
MKTLIGATVTAVALLSGALAAADPPRPSPGSAPLPRLARPKTPQHIAPLIPAAEPNTEASTSTGVAKTSAFAAVSPGASSGTTLTGPSTLTYSGASAALLVSQSGFGRGVSVSVSNVNSGSSALYGQTSGSGAGLTGYNLGTGGPGGKFEVTNAKSGQPAVYATTVGGGPAILATGVNFNTPAIEGQNTSDYGVGIEGDGSTGSDATGVLGTTTGGSGVSGTATTGVGVSGSSEGSNQSDNSAGVYGYSTIGYGVYGYGDNGIGIYAYSQNNTALYAYSESTTGGYAAYFQGPAYVEGTLTANSYVTASDKNIKDHFEAIDRESILDRVSELPVTSWEFKSDKTRLRHVGPMAQDFHAAFHLNGDDDKHINLADMAGVSLAAIQELNTQMKAKDAEIAELKVRCAAQEKTVAAITDAFSARMTALEQQRDGRTKTAALTAASPIAGP